MKRKQPLFLFAAADMGIGRHLADLRELNPELDEIETAARWVTQQDPSEGFREVLKDMLKEIGYEEASEGL